MSTPRPAADVVAAVLRLANDVHGVAQRGGRTDLSGLLAAQAGRWGESQTTVVLAGAQKRGKSRLLNVLVGHPELLPVDADIATHTHVAIRRGDRLRVVVHRAGDAAQDTEIDPADLADYASVLGDPQRRAGVTGVDVSIDEPLLEGICLVDTPGVDSLTLGHRHATMAALARADVLVFAVSAQDQPILRHELEFLAEAAQRLHAVAFVLTKVEDTASWRELLAENRERLTTFVTQASVAGELDAELGRRLREAPWLPVSAKLGEAALALEAAGRPERAAARAQRSGLPALRGYLRRCADRRDLVRAGGVLVLTESVLRSLTAAGEDKAIAGGEDTGSVQARRAELDAELAELAELKRERRRRSIDHQFLGQEVAHRARARLESYRRNYEREIADLTPKTVAGYAEELPASLARSLDAAWEQICADTEHVAQESLTRFVADLGVDAADLDREALARRGATTVEAPQQAAAAGLDIVGEGLPAVMMAGGVGFMTHNLLTFMAVAAGVAVAAPVLIGAGLATTLLVHRRKVAAAARNRTALTRGVAEAFAAAAGEMSLAAQQAVATWRAAAEQAVDAALAAQQRELEARRTELAALAARDGAQRRRAAEEAEEQLGRIAELVSRAERLRGELTAALRAGDAAADDAPAAAGKGAAAG